MRVLMLIALLSGIAACDDGHIDLGKYEDAGRTDRDEDEAGDNDEDTGEQT